MRYHRSMNAMELRALDGYWRATNYLSVGQIYLCANPLLRETLRPAHIKPRLLGHWGTTPGLNFVWAHLNRAIQRHDLNALFIAGPGHGGPAVLANAYLEGTYSERYPHIGMDIAGMARFFKQFSFPGGVPSHASPQSPGSMHEGGELGYSLAHAFGAAFDNPDLLACCVVGDGEAETGALATSWHGNKFLNPARDGAVLPVLHLNGYKIAGPTVLARIPNDELLALFTGYGYEPIVVSGDDPATMHALMADALERCVTRIASIQHDARAHGFRVRPRWPMLILRTPKGWTGPKFVDGVAVEGTFRAHQVPLGEVRENPEHLAELEAWMRSYRPEELFDESGRIHDEWLRFVPAGTHRMSANPHANGGELLRDLVLADFSAYAVEVPTPGGVRAEGTRPLGALLRDALQANPTNFRVLAPDETNSNRLNAVFEVTSRTSTAIVEPYDDHVAPDGRVMEILSEHVCQGWLEGYLLTGRHGLFSCYEAFVHIVDSMFNQHAKWLKVSREIPWRRPIASLNYLLTSHVWRQDHNGFSHQDPGFIDHVANKKSDVVRVYLPPDANTLLCVTDHCLRSRNYVNVIVAGKQPEWQWLDIESARMHCAQGLGIWEWASNDGDRTPDLIMACAGDVPTLETLAAVDLLRARLPEIALRVVNVVDLMALQTRAEHPHGLDDARYDAIFPPGVPVIFAFHGYPVLVHRLTYKRHNHDDLHVHGYREEGSTTTPFDMTVRNRLSRFHLALDALSRVDRVQGRAGALRQWIDDRLAEHELYITEHGEDMPMIRDWQWSGARCESSP